jgi:hypothetical protein
MVTWPKDNKLKNKADIKREHSAANITQDKLRQLEVKVFNKIPPKNTVTSKIQITSP